MAFNNDTFKLTNPAPSLFWPANAAEINAIVVHPAPPNLAPYLTIAVANTTFVPLAQRGVANGVATLDASGKVPTSQLPPYPDISGLLPRTEAAATYITINAANATFAPLAHNHDASYISLASRGVANGVATLDASGRLPVSQLPRPTKLVFNIIPPFGYSVTDFELKAMNANGDMVYFYHSPDPTRSFITEQIWQTKPTVRFASKPTYGEDPRIQKVQGNKSIAAQIGSNPVVWGFVIEIPASEVPDGAQWVYSLMTPSAFIGNYAPYTAAWFPIAPQEKF